ncbi:MAG: adenylate kinase [Bacteroidota bacterium]|nr:adenylate kinase [Bacteroidota bacterium]
MLNIALFGPPGAGKGTQSMLLLEKYNLTYISTGDILRAEIKAKTELGIEAKKLIDKGNLVPDELIVQIIEKKITDNANSNGFLFDGFPRTMVQAYILEALLLKINATLNCMLCLDVPEDELMRRLLERGKISGRSDDNEEVIKSRLIEYKTKTFPVIDFYKVRNQYIPIEGTGTVDEVFQLLSDAIDETLTTVWLNIVLLGAPGAGKGTQGRLLAEKHNLYYISTGAKLRREVKMGTEIGMKAKKFLEKGELVPDEIIIQLIENEIKKHPNVRGFVFKGFPRTMLQAYILDGLLRRLNSSVSVALEVKAPTLELFKRLFSRGKTDKARSYDMTPELIIGRLEEYEQKTARVVEYYKKQGKYKAIEGLGTTDEIFETLTTTVDTAFHKAR